MESKYGFTFSFNKQNMVLLSNSLLNSHQRQTPYIYVIPPSNTLKSIHNHIKLIITIIILSWVTVVKVIYI